MSAIIITLWYVSITTTRISSYLFWTCFGINFTVFIFNEPMFDLKINSAARIYSRVLGKLCSGLFVTVLINSRILGITILSWIFVFNSAWYSLLLVQLNLIPATVLTNKVDSFPSSIYYNPFGDFFKRCTAVPHLWTINPFQFLLSNVTRNLFFTRFMDKMLAS